MSNPLSAGVALVLAGIPSPAHAQSWQPTGTIGYINQFDARGDHLWALPGEAADLEGNGDVLYSADGGQSFVTIGSVADLGALSAENIRWASGSGTSSTLFATGLYQQAMGTRVYRSEDGGASWEVLALPDGLFSLGNFVDHIGISPAFDQDGTILVGNEGVGNHTYYSFDGGDSWSQASTHMRGSTYGFAPDFGISRRVFGFTQLVPFRSSDGGANWDSCIGYGGVPCAVLDQEFVIEILDDTAGTILAGGVHLSGASLYRSTGDGLGFDEVQGEIRDQIVYDLATLGSGDSTVVYAGTSNGVYRSEDLGVTWTHLNAPGLPASHVSRLEVAGASGDKLFGLVSAGTLHQRPGGELMVLDLGKTCGTGVESYCVAAPNSVGPGATLSMSGSRSISANAFTLESSGGIPNGFGLIYYGPTRIQAAFGDGFRCVGGQTHRVQPILQTDPNGHAVRSVDFTVGSPSTGPGRILPGSTWNFQHWYRDAMGPGGSGFNVSDGLSVGFCE